MDKKNPTDFLQSDQILLLPTKQPPPYSSSSSSDNDQNQSQSTDAQPDKKKQNSSSGQGGSGTSTNNNSTTTATNFVYFGNPTYNYSTPNTTIAAAADGVNLSTAANVAYGNPSLTPVISVPPGLNTGMASGTDALPSSNIFPVTQVEETAAEIAEVAIATAAAVATVRATPVRTSATPSTTFAVSLATVATP
ncbi:hypothetical protein EC957_001610 [Mortierella hygrophila]|uniref:Uncharacterized protein n=1 Tax=Mortierella hygrophila TaxID=979708 RepID=A0A9P6K7N8_9FUNG|nr:hypothetical protein EC957_001610 [Mortierella hygrophila]